VTSAARRPRRSSAGRAQAALPAVIRPRIVVRPNLLVGPGKIDLLRAIDAQGSISAAARACDMSYRRAWSLLAELNRGLRAPVLVSTAGGRGGGGATLTRAGRALIEAYLALERDCTRAADAHLRRLRRLFRA
jgi:molybdate transport system regulatory protein